MPEHYIEVLSPAGGKESLIAAVRAGADAVYMGAKQFSARRHAENFNENELSDAVRYCHERGVKVYITVNISVKSSELEDAFNTVKKAYLSGVDAVIITDLGLAALIKKSFPDLELHASTQMSIHSPASLGLLKKLGFSRVVVSREMSRDELAVFCAEAQKQGIEVEVFVHGALCMSVSGQCLMSSVLGARSGNRGLCAGPCRLPFAANGGTGHDLSLKDLSLLDYVAELENMGVCSLKIEGRMKRPEYIAAATAAARETVDNGFVSEKLNGLLCDVFSRSGFTDGYYTGNRGRDMFGIRTKDDVVSSKEALSEIHGLYRGERQSVGITLSLCAITGEKSSLTVSDGVNTVTVYGDTVEKASSKPADEQTVKVSLLKLGQTPYFALCTDVRISDDAFLSAAEINALRRSAAEKLSVLRGKNLRKSEASYIYGIPEDKIRRKKELIARFNSAEDIPDDLSSLSAIILPLYAAAPEIMPDIPLFAEIPRYSPNDKRVSARLDALKKAGYTGAFCSNLSALCIAKQSGLKVMCGMGFNVLNGETAALLQNAGADYITLSAEIAVADIKKISCDAKKGIFAYGRLPLMATVNCPIKNGKSCAQCDKKGVITDRMGISFPVRCNGSNSEILNSAPTYIADRLNELDGNDFLLLWFYDEDKTEAADIINAYKNGSPPPQKYTRGLYYKTLL